MSNLKPITLYSHASGPNSWKVAIVLEELGVPYENKFMSFPAMKQEPYTSINPNGRVPSIEDPNTGIKLFESGAILQYIIETYDTTHKLSHASSPEKYHSYSWLHFQTSGQGPYFGQKAWFSHFHPEKNITSAIDRYANEIRRVLSVVDKHLEGKEWLVGDKCTYADLAWLPWGNNVPVLMIDQEGFSIDEYPNYKAWMERMVTRPKVAKVLQDREKAIAEEKH